MSLTAEEEQRETLEAWSRPALPPQLPINKGRRLGLFGPHNVIPVAQEGGVRKGKSDTGSVHTSHLPDQGKNEPHGLIKEGRSGVDPS